ncbi:nitroreductase family deazaflavin-dependent oxidoreductase [Candidatus Leptofilum sp.]|uniref:nitroreductase family deazaflavin-dependent oxidoreductase n=1 Tax=Candidatus Leptofilum sp. TaxID=3241576 RepID=UPI003B5A0C03
MSSNKSLLQKINTRIAMSAVGAQIMARTMHHLDRLVLRMSNGRATATTLLAGLQVLNLTTIGTKSGQPRTVPLLAIPFADNQLVIIASNWGQQKNPAWYYNIVAHPEVTVTRDGRSQTYLARETDSDERAACWQAALETYPGYAAYERRTSRRIPVILLTPAKN